MDEIRKMWEKIPCTIRAIVLMLSVICGYILLKGLLLNVEKDIANNSIVITTIIYFILICIIVKKRYDNHYKGKLSDYIKCITIDYLPMWFLVIVFMSNYYEKLSFAEFIHGQELSHNSLYYFFSVFLSALNEEVLFRVILIEYTINKRGKLCFWQVLLYGIIFGVAHFASFFLSEVSLQSVMIQVILATLWGITATILYYHRGRSVIILTFLHCIYNYGVNMYSRSASLVDDMRLNLLAWCGKEYYVETYIGIISVYFVSVFVAMIFGIIIYYKEYRKEKNTDIINSLSVNEEVTVIE